MKKVILPKTCIYCQKNLTCDSIEGTTWTCHLCKKTKKSRHESYSFPILYAEHNSYRDGTLESLWLCLKEYCIIINYEKEQTFICKILNPYQNILITLNYLPDLDFMDRAKIAIWAKGLHQIVAFS